MKHMPKSVTCQQLALQSIRKTTPALRTAKTPSQPAVCSHRRNWTRTTLILGRNELGVDFDQTPVMVRSHFPESWLWEAYPISRGVKTVRKPLPDSLTTWDIKAISMSSTGICVAESVQVQVTQPVSIDVPLPYQLIGGNRWSFRAQYTTSEHTHQVLRDADSPIGVCLLGPTNNPGRDGLRSTSCNQMLTLHGGGVRRVTFTVLGLEPGEHTLTFTLKTLKRGGDIVEKKLRVVPEGVRKELLSGGTWTRQCVRMAQEDCAPEHTAGQRGSRLGGEEAGDGPW
ncbi:hypothetical protein INR49_022887 [Caranx melampygus]|nr:hypothetical protein INR49_022887 [Caranx melampygus]